MKPDVQAQIRQANDRQQEFEQWVREELVKHELAIEELCDREAGAKSRLRRAFLLVGRLFEKQ
jgi:hypothetical protein